MRLRERILKGQLKAIIIIKFYLMHLLNARGIRMWFFPEHNQEKEKVKAKRKTEREKEKQ